MSFSDELALAVSPEFVDEERNRRFVSPKLHSHARFGGCDERNVNNERISGQELRLLPYQYATFRVLPSRSVTQETLTAGHCRLARCMSDGLKTLNLETQRMVIDSNAVLPRTVTTEPLQPVRWGNAEIIKCDGIVEHAQLALADLLDAKLLGMVTLFFLYNVIYDGLSEEPGWRGFALPILQAKFSPLVFQSTPRSSLGSLACAGEIRRNGSQECL